MSGRFGIVRTGAAARNGRRRRDCARPWLASLGASASAADVGRRSDGPSHCPGREPVVGHALDRAARHRRPARPHRPPCGLGWSARSCAPWSAGSSAGRGRAAAGRFDVADSYAPCWWDARSDPRRGTLPRPGAGGWTRCRARPRRARAETRASGARTPRSRQPEPRPGRVITALIPKCDVFGRTCRGIGITLTRWGVP